MAVVYEDQRLPASYADFYIANKYVIVTGFRYHRDDKAGRIIQDCLPGREVVGIDSTNIIWSRREIRRQSTRLLEVRPSMKLSWLC